MSRLAVCQPPWRPGPAAPGAILGNGGGGPALCAGGVGGSGQGERLDSRTLGHPSPTCTSWGPEASDSGSSALLTCEMELTTLFQWGVGKLLGVKGVRNIFTCLLNWPKDNKIEKQANKKLLTPPPQKKK